ncbi:MAG: 7TM diverse intracellular signaling domain-containing protein [Bernardetiaceae bacterium]
MEGSSVLVEAETRYLDASNAPMQLSEVLQQLDRFLPPPEKGYNFGYSATEIWINFVVVNQSNDPRWILHFNTAFLRWVDVYTSPEGSTHWEHLTLGNGYPFPSRQIDHVTPAEELFLPLGTKIEFLIRCRTDSPMIIPMYLRTPSNFKTHVQNHHIAYGIYFGVMLVMMLFNAFVFYVLRERSYIYYIASIMSILLTVLALSGYGFKYLYGDYPMLNGLVARVSAGLTVLFTALFAQVFLRTQHFVPLMHRVLQGMIVLVLVAEVLVLTDIWSQATGKLVSLQTIVLITTGVWAWRKGNQYARFYVFAWTIYIIGGLTYTLQISGTLPVNFWTTHGVEIGSVFEVVLIALALSDQYRVIQRERESAIGKALEVERKSAETLERKVQERTYALKEANQELNQLNEELNAAFETVNIQKEDIEKKNQSITSSIQYAQRIQRAMLPDIEEIKRTFVEAFVFFRPRDGVSGDFYFFKQKGDDVFIAAVDCTGHGVPGAFMSMIANDLLHQSIDEENAEPSQILMRLHQGVRRALRQETTQNQDGMAISLCRIRKKEGYMEFAGSKQGILLIQSGNPVFLKGSRYDIGGWQRNQDTRSYQTHRIELDRPTTFYLYSDGFPDQIGGINNKKLLSKPFRHLLYQQYKKTMDEQASFLHQFLVDWMDKEAQLDDILVIGIRLSPIQ